MEIRPFREIDTEEVVRLWRRCELVVPQNDPYKDIIRKVKVQPELFLVGLDGDRIVAAVMAGYDGHRGWINYLAVDPTLRRRGLGRMIMDEAERRLQAAGCPKVNLQVRRTNSEVLAFYRSIGYTEDDVSSMGKRLVRDEPARRWGLASGPDVAEAEGGRINELGQPIGPAVDSFKARFPPRTPMLGRYCSLLPLDSEIHAGALWEAYSDDRDGRIWTYLTSGPFVDFKAFRVRLDELCTQGDHLLYVIIGSDGQAAGMASYLRVQPRARVIEVGGIAYAPRLQGTTEATEAMYLMMRRAFDELGYRRCEWKCDALNAASRNAALRLGFTYEGTFRQATVYKGRSRDTAWFSVIDKEWPGLRRAFEAWLDPTNFDTSGVQRQPLSSFRALATYHRSRDLPDL